MLHMKFQNEGNFTASDGWLTLWKKQHEAHFLRVCREKVSADVTGANEF